MLLFAQITIIVSSHILTTASFRLLHKTFFRHIDLNILKLVNEKKEQYMIQGSVSLNNEKKEDCTEMLLKCIIILMNDERMFKED
jgi:hypothetical protein